MGRDEGRFNASLIVRGRVTKTAAVNHNFGRERKAQLNRTVVLLLVSLTPHRWAKPCLPYGGGDRSLKSMLAFMTTSHGVKYNVLTTASSGLHPSMMGGMPES